MKSKDTLEARVKKGHIIAEALPYIEKFQGDTFVVKYGGSLMVHDDKRLYLREILFYLNTWELILLLFMEVARKSPNG